MFDPPLWNQGGPQPDAQPTNRRINQHKTAADTSLRSASFAGAEEIDDGADGWEGIALGRGEADIECGFELIAELDQVERITTKIPNKGGVEMTQWKLLLSIYKRHYSIACLFEINLPRDYLLNVKKIL